MTAADAGALIAGADAGHHRNLTVLEGWRAFIGHAPGSPRPMTARARDRMPEDEQLDYDEQRIDYHVRLGVIQTPLLGEVVRAGRLLTILNREAVSARRGLIVSGQAGTGKTTALAQFGKRHEILDRRRNPSALPGSRIPVVYVTVPAGATAKMLAVEFARFLGLPVPSRANITDVTESVCGVLTDCRASLVLVDEIHNLELATRGGGEVSDILKYFSERIPATFAYAGINVEREGLFAGTRGEQIAGRFTLLATRRFPPGEQWQSIVATFDKALMLCRHKPGTLAGLETYLHDRTGGRIGSLSHLIRGAAVEAILSGTEKITRAAMEAIPLDHAAEQQRPARPAPRKKAPGGQPAPSPARPPAAPPRRDDHQLRHAARRRQPPARRLAATRPVHDRLPPGTARPRPARRSQRTGPGRPAARTRRPRLRMVRHPARHHHATGPGRPLVLTRLLPPREPLSPRARADRRLQGLRNDLRAPPGRRRAQEMVLARLPATGVQPPQQAGRSEATAQTPAAAPPAPPPGGSSGATLHRMRRPGHPPASRQTRGMVLGRLPAATPQKPQPGADSLRLTSSN